MFRRSESADKKEKNEQEKKKKTLIVGLQRSERE